VSKGENVDQFHGLHVLAFGQEERMPKTSRRHSVKKPHYHNNTKCGPGREIPPHDKVSGTGSNSPASSQTFGISVLSEVKYEQGTREGCSRKGEG
jgi:hypothetical protein